MTVIVMSRRDLSRLQVLIDVADRRLAVEDAAALMGVTGRQTYRLLEVFRQHGADGLVSKRRGRPSNRAHSPVLRETVLAIIRDRYRDFGPTLAAEKLREQHGLPVGVETLHQWMVSGRHLDQAPRSPDADSSAAASPRPCRRADPDRWLRALVVRGARSAMHAAGVRRRCDAS